MFGTSGIRGRVGEDVTADLALAVGRALAAEGYGRVVIGRDPRDSGTILADVLAAGLREGGADAIRLDLASTPTVARSVGWFDAHAGVSVTASHNPPPDNGIKLWTPSGQALDADRRDAIARRVEGAAYDLQPWDGIGKEIQRVDAPARHVDALAGIAEGADLAVAVDLGNGAGGVTLDAILEAGCSVETLNAQPDGRFPGRPSEPTAEHCRTLRRLVAGSDVDLGIAHDGDADRMLAVTGQGEWVQGDILLALFAREAAGSGDAVAAPLNTSLAVDDALADVGASVTRTPVGDVHVAAAASQPGVVFGGEPSGAWIWPDETLCPDGHLAAVKLVDLIARRGSLAELAAEIRSYPTRREHVEVADKAAVMERVEATVHQEYDDIGTLDGVRVDLGDAWFLIRASGTQPLVRVTAEARDPGRADTVAETARAIVDDAIED